MRDRGTPSLSKNALVLSSDEAVMLRLTTICAATFSPTAWAIDKYSTSLTVLEQSLRIRGSYGQEDVISGKKNANTYRKTER
jgi:hypothetical protein